MDPLVFHTPDHLSVDAAFPSGALRVETHDTDRTEVRVEMVRNPDDLDVRFEDRPGGAHRLSIEYRGPKFGLRDKEAVISVRCPVGTDISMTTGSADLRISGPAGRIDLRSGSGDISFDDAAGDVHIKIASGDIEGGRIAGALHMYGASGDIRLREIEGSLVVKTASGDIAIDAAGGDVTVTSVSGDVDIGALHGGSAQIRSVSGDVRVGVVAGTAVFLDLHATSGQARSDLTPSEGRSGSEPLLELKVSTVSGDIHVHRSPAPRPD